MTLYDWPIAKSDLFTVPTAIQLAVKDVLSLEVAAVPLTKDVNVKLSPERMRIFNSLQEFERKPLQDLRSGRLSQSEYLETLKQRSHDYREVDMELIKDVDTNLERILRLRERFGARGGWKLVRDFLSAYDRNEEPKVLNDIDKDLRDRLRYCFKPLLKEYGSALWKIAKGSVSFLPVMGEAKDAAELIKPTKEVGRLIAEDLRFVRGEIRRGRR